MHGTRCHVTTSKRFKKTGIANALDGSEDDQLWKDDTEEASDLDNGSSGSTLDWCMWIINEAQ